jgi:hypothetical protein
MEFCKPEIENKNLSRNIHINPNTKDQQLEKVIKIKLNKESYAFYGLKVDNGPSIIKPIPSLDYSKHSQCDSNDV